MKKTTFVVAMLAVATVSSAQARKLKVYISADMEGIGGVSTWSVASGSSMARIANTVLAYDLALATRNRRDFSRVSRQKLASYRAASEILRRVDGTPSLAVEPHLFETRGR